MHLILHPGAHHSVRLPVHPLSCEHKATRVLLSCRIKAFLGVTAKARSWGRPRGFISVLRCRTACSSPVSASTAEGVDVHALLLEPHCTLSSAPSICCALLSEAPRRTATHGRLVLRGVGCQWCWNSYQDVIAASSARHRYAGLYGCQVAVQQHIAVSTAARVLVYSLSWAHAQKVALAV